MSVFDKNIEKTSTITAQRLFDLHNNLGAEFGHASSSFMYGDWHFQDLDQVSEEKIDAVIDDILSYIYYIVKLGLDNHQINKFEQGIPAEVFGITPYNKDSEAATEMLNKITKKFADLGFDIFLLYNDNMIRIEWYRVTKNRRFDGIE